MIDTKSTVAVVCFALCGAIFFMAKDVGEFMFDTVYRSVMLVIGKVLKFVKQSQTLASFHDWVGHHSSTMILWIRSVSPVEFPSWIVYVALTLCTLFIGLGIAGVPWQENCRKYLQLLFDKTEGYFYGNQQNADEQFPEFASHGPWWKRLTSWWRRPWRKVDLIAGWDLGDDKTTFLGDVVQLAVTAPNGHKQQDEVQFVRLNDNQSDSTTLDGKLIDVVQRWPWSADSEQQQYFTTTTLEMPGNYFVRYVIFPDGRPTHPRDSLKEGKREAGYTLHSLGPIKVQAPQLTPKSMEKKRWGESLEVSVQTLNKHDSNDTIELEYFDVSEDANIVAQKTVPKKGEKSDGPVAQHFTLIFSGKDTAQRPGVYRFLYRSGKSQRIWATSDRFTLRGPYLKISSTDSRSSITSSGNENRMDSSYVVAWGSPLTIVCVSSQCHGSDDYIVLRRCEDTADTTMSAPEWFSSHQRLKDVTRDQDFLNLRKTDQEVRLPVDQWRMKIRFGPVNPKEKDDDYHLINAHRKGLRQPGHYYVMYVSRHTKHQESWVPFGTKPPRRIMSCVGPIVVAGPEIYPCSNQGCIVFENCRNSIDLLSYRYIQDLLPNKFESLLPTSNNESVRRQQIWWGSDAFAFCAWSRYRNPRKDRVYLQRIGDLPRSDPENEERSSTERTMEFAFTQFLGVSPMSPMERCSVKCLGLNNDHGAPLDVVTPVEQPGALTTVSSVNYSSNAFDCPSNGKFNARRTFPSFGGDEGNTGIVYSEVSALVPFTHEKAPSLPGIYRYVYELNDPEDEWSKMYFGSAPFVVSGPKVNFVKDDATTLTGKEVDLSTFWGEAVPAEVESSPFRNSSQSDYLALVPVIRSDHDEYLSVADVVFSSSGKPTNVNSKASSYPPVAEVPPPRGRTEDGSSCAMRFPQKVYFEGEKAPPRPGYWQLVYYARPTNGYTNVPKKIAHGPCLRVHGPTLKIAVQPHRYSEPSNGKQWFNWNKTAEEKNDETAKRMVEQYQSHAPVVSVPPKVDVEFDTAPAHNPTDWIAITRIGGAPDDAYKNRIYRTVGTATQGCYHFGPGQLPAERGEYQAVYVRGETGLSFLNTLGVQSVDPSTMIHTKHAFVEESGGSFSSHHVTSVYDVIARSSTTFKIELDPNGQRCAIQESSSAGATSIPDFDGDSNRNIQQDTLGQSMTEGIREQRGGSRSGRNVSLEHTSEPINTSTITESATVQQSSALASHECVSVGDGDGTNASSGSSLLQGIRRTQGKPRGNKNGGTSQSTRPPNDSGAANSTGGSSMLEEQGASEQASSAGKCSLMESIRKQDGKPSTTGQAKDTGSTGNYLLLESIQKQGGKPASKQSSSGERKTTASSKGDISLPRRDQSFHDDIKRKADRMKRSSQRQAGNATNAAAETSASQSAASESRSSSERIAYQKPKNLLSQIQDIGGNLNKVGKKGTSKFAGSQRKHGRANDSKSIAGASASSKTNASGGVMSNLLAHVQKGNNTELQDLLDKRRKHLEMPSDSDEGSSSSESDE